MIRRALVLAALLAATGCPADNAATPANGTVATEPKTTTTTTPTAAPKAAPTPFDRATAKTPWRHARVGDWATYKSALGKVKLVKFEVTAVSDDTVTFSRKNAESGAVLGDATIDLADEESRYKEWAAYDALVKPPYTEKTTVGGKELEVLIIKRAASGNSTELWVAENDVPAFNQCAVKSIRNGDLELELVDWGRGQ